jgi:hypothetical protein
MKIVSYQVTRDPNTFQPCMLLTISVTIEPSLDSTPDGKEKVVSKLGSEFAKLLIGLDNEWQQRK